MAACFKFYRNVKAIYLEGLECFCLLSHSHFYLCYTCTRNLDSLIFFFPNFLCFCCGNVPMLLKEFWNTLHWYILSFLVLIYYFQLLLMPIYPQGSIYIQSAFLFGNLCCRFNISMFLWIIGTMLLNRFLFFSQFITFVG